MRALVPPKQLLVFDVKEGWAPLCEFLQVPVPDVPFPNINDANEIRSYDSNEHTMILPQVCLPSGQAVVMGKHVAGGRLPSLCNATGAQLAHHFN